jgi:hypothetical protein
MQRLTSRTVLLGALAVVWGCSGDPTNNKGTPTDIVADPTILVITDGGSKATLVSAVDEDGQALEADFAVTDATAGITAALDPTFRPTIGAKPIKTQARINVSVAPGTPSGSFVVNALGLTKTVTVDVTPAGP